MFQEMFNGSIAVLTRPSAATFEEYEKDNLAWALIYSIIAGVINGVLGAARAALFPTVIDTSTMSPEMAAQMEQFAAASGGGVVGALIGALIFTPIGLLIAWGITYGLGRAFGGTGSFGELAWGLSLFGAPMTVVSSVLAFIPILGGIAALALVVYNFYLTYLAIQSGMNLEPRKALYVILVQLAIGLAIFACFCALAGSLLMAAFGLSNSAP